MNLPEILSILRTAEEGSRFLSDDVLLVLGWKIATTRESIFTKRHTWISPVGIEYVPESRPCPTTNLSAGIKWMIPEGFSVLMQTGEGGHLCMLWETENPPRTAQMLPGATIELALAITAFELRRSFL